MGRPEKQNFELKSCTAGHARHVAAHVKGPWCAGCLSCRSPPPTAGDPRASKQSECCLVEGHVPTERLGNAGDMLAPRRMTIYSGSADVGKDSEVAQGAGGRDGPTAAQESVSSLFPYMTCC